MILLLNVFITDTKLPNFICYNRGLYPEGNPYNIFKYSLASLSVIDWSDVIIYCKLDENYIHNELDLEIYVKSIFENPKIFSYRNENRDQWEKAINELSDDLIWFSCNHDHIFLCYDLNYLNIIKKELVNYDEFTSVYYSHYPELVTFSTESASFKNEKYFFSYTSDSADSIQVVRKPLLSKWFLDDDYKDHFMGRSDLLNKIKHTVLVPKREMCRHFDGYDRNSHMKQRINQCPPLFIPDGFFENSMKISFGQKISDYLNIDPCNPNYSCVSLDGTDYKNPIPLFWKDRIVDIVGNYKENLNCNWELANAFRPIDNKFKSQLLGSSMDFIL